MKPGRGTISLAEQEVWLDKNLVLFLCSLGFRTLGLADNILEKEHSEFKPEDIMCLVMFFADNIIKICYKSKHRLYSML